MVRVTLDPLAVNLRIPVVTWAATTRRAVILSVTFGVDGAFIVQNAGIDALAIVASSRVIALAVRLAVEFEASQLRIPRIAWQTYARRIMIDDITLSVGPAIAWIDTRAIDARIVSCTFVV